MTIILAIDPGKTTGWASYYLEGRRPVGSGSQLCHGIATDELDARLVPDEVGPPPDLIVIERPKGYGPTRPEMVDCGIVAGELWAQARDEWGDAPRYWMDRIEVRKTLQQAVHSAIHVRNDATAWAALVHLHGEGSDARGRKATKKVPGVEPGPLAGITSHSRAALAVAVAFAIKRGLWGSAQ